MTESYVTKELGPDLTIIYPNDGWNRVWLRSSVGDVPVWWTEAPDLIAELKQRFEPDQYGTQSGGSVD